MNGWPCAFRPAAHSTTPRHWSSTPGVCRPETHNRVVADRGDDSQANRHTPDKHGLTDGITRRAKPGQIGKCLR